MRKICGQIEELEPDLKNAGKLLHFPLRNRLAGGWTSPFGLLHQRIFLVE
ncbi:hypothetical protein RB5634 [Rhodopirellula baltica SH 1]|uniref:Uncharacterized protein n=1 Tax=Rhodopirellula baltica (strain DSM 10527 / NCIMB 13988 / SH1) TaxID=243090 RepID=Q7URJ0_RHOBA|nr:hypothetical protein RB5634 [Rhodopirellula baltica SH 1]